MKTLHLLTACTHEIYTPKKLLARTQEVLSIDGIMPSRNDVHGFLAPMYDQEMHTMVLSYSTPFDPYTSMSVAVDPSSGLSLWDCMGEMADSIDDAIASAAQSEGTLQIEGPQEFIDVARILMGQKFYDKHYIVRESNLFMAQTRLH